MDPIVTGALISAGSKLLGGLIGGGSNNHAGRDQRQATSFANYSAVADKVKAANDYGISPLYALGAPAISVSSAVGQPAGGGLGEALSGMGQDIGRSVAAQQTADQRMATRLALESASLDNQLKAAQLAKLNAPGSPPPMPLFTPGGGVSGDVGVPRRDTMVDASGNVTTVDKGVDPAQNVQNEYGDVAENIEGMMHYFTDKFVRPMEQFAYDRLGPMGLNNPWAAGADSAELLRSFWRMLMRKPKRYNERLPQE